MIPHEKLRASLSTFAAGRSLNRVEMSRLTNGDPSLLRWARRRNLVAPIAGGYRVTARGAGAPTTAALERIRAAGALEAAEKALEGYGVGIVRALGRGKGLMAARGAVYAAVLDVCGGSQADVGRVVGKRLDAVWRGLAAHRRRQAVAA